METPRFLSALDELLAAAEIEPTVIMCAEAVPWRCHRSLISDAAVARGAEVRHIIDSADHEHRLTSFAWIDGSRVRYDDATQNELFAPRSS
jgi:uncharacterized protein (DUF488 family)